MQGLVSTVATLAAITSSVYARPSGPIGYGAIVSDEGSCVYNDDGIPKLADCETHETPARLGRGGFSSGKGWLRTDDDIQKCLATDEDSETLKFITCTGDESETSTGWQQTGLGALKHNGRCLEANGDVLTLGECGNAANQKFTFDVEMYNNFRDAKIEYGTVMNYGFSLRSGRHDVMYISDNSEETTQFHFFADGDGSFRTSDGRCLTILADFTDEESVIRTVSCDTLDDTHLYNFVYDGTTIQIADTDKCLMADRTTSANGGTGYDVTVRDCHADWPEQQWVVSAM